MKVKKLNHRQAHWSLLLACFDFIMHHQLGKSVMASNNYQITACTHVWYWASYQLSTVVYFGSRFNLSTKRVPLAVVLSWGFESEGCSGTN